MSRYLTNLVAEPITKAFKAPLNEIFDDGRKIVESDEFKRAIEIGSHVTWFGNYAIFLIPIIVICFMGIIFLVYWFNRGTTEQEQKTADGIFTGVMSALGISFALAGIYSMPYLTSASIRSTADQWGKAILYYNTGIAPKHFEFSDGSTSNECGLVTNGNGKFKDPYVDHCGTDKKPST